ncbi:hypothetical protein [Pseudoteredinibacter isoporae]|uniref:Uncharacterized protein n=1 Tax=Pseudoteredinibacter isoporae TaxID=570281 RepID=A0A7X0JWD9_9GAMM|nr:hypothetical protein [Pseudoteredinibacter isoporae]MBB6523432.1 hypothetical protein [Pseudoteredinibacter isoporae]NHO88943.1 hypothetical protein [Pseudoteredinibacter isoporae]NIB24349.1 hypothetical protein [Pseudoteredinibacter isoporae]
MSSGLRWCLCGLLCLCVAACSSSSRERLPRGATDHIKDAAPAVALEQAEERPELERLINIGIPVFTIANERAKREGTESEFGAWVGKEILEIERQYLPLILRNTLVASNQWGAVRVLPQADVSTDLQIMGTVLHSDGAVLSFRVVARDSTGREWLNKIYSARYASSQEGIAEDDKLSLSDFDTDLCLKVDKTSAEPYENLYKQVANDLLVVRETLTDQELQNIQRIANIRHAQDLAPMTFDDLLEKDQQGRYVVKRLLAHNDPMQARVDSMRLRHQFFIDTVDVHYQGLHKKMGPIYKLWARYSCERDLELQLRRMSGEDGMKRISAGGFEAISNSYRRYNINKIFEQEWNSLAKSFTIELNPVIVELNDKVYTLKGSAEQQYEQWRALLSEFYKLENAVP